MDKKKIEFRKTLVIGISFLFIGTGIIPSFALENNNENEISKLTFYTFDKTGSRKCEVEISEDIADDISNRFEILKNKISRDPVSDETSVLKSDFVDLLDFHGLIPSGMSKDYVVSLLDPWWLRFADSFNRYYSRGDSGERIRDGVLPGPLGYRGSAFFCGVAGFGAGFMFLPVMMPRPRLLTSWSSLIYAGSYATNLFTGRGFIAEGAQFGSALGFMGVGLSFVYPGIPAIYTFYGYALFARVTAESVDTYPPNSKPTITDENPSDGSINVPISLSELSFRIGDLDLEKMSYTVTTSPDIGSGSGNGFGGVYSIPVSGLKSNTEYTWSVVVTDDKDVTEKTFSFHTEIKAPIVTVLSPFDGDNWVSVNISELSFRLEDLQGDLMDYTVETVPDIGSSSGNQVGDGVYNVPVGGLEYTRDYSWFVNVTDGEYWARDVFKFKTQPKMIFDPFNEDWSYRKKITIDHSQVTGDLSGFPVLVSIIDSDLRDKAQSDGDDVLFMDGSGVANRLFHEIESFDYSTGELFTWVNIPSLSSSNDTVLYLYYGNSGCSGQQYPDKVWDSNYQAVWHLSEEGLGLRYDSTNNENHGTPYHFEGDEAVSGKIDGADEFDGNNDHIRTGVSFDYDYRTVSFWINTDNKPSSDPNAILSQNADTLNYGQIYANIQSDGLHAKAGGEGAGGEFIFNINLDTWYLVQLIRDHQITKYYVNGNLIDTGNSGNTGSSHGANPNLIIGSSRYYDRLFDGITDELRVSNIVRSSDWISTEYNNQNNPSSFYSVGPEEAGP